MRFAVSTYAIILFLTAAVSTSVMLVVWKKRRIHGARILFLMLLAGTEWALTGGFEAAAIGQESKILWSKLEYIGFTVLPALLVVFAFEYKTEGKRLPLAVRLALFAPALITVALAFTNELHGLIWAGFNPGPSGSNSMIYARGSGYWVMTVVNLSFVFIAVMRIFSSARRSRGLFHFQDVFLMFAALFPIIGAALYLMPHPLFPGLDMVLLSFMFTCFCLAAGMLRFRLFDLAPIAREKVMESMKNGVIVLDLSHRIVDANSTARLFGSNPGLITPGSAMSERFPWWTGVSDLASGEHREEILEFEDQYTHTRTAELTISALQDRKKRILGWLLILHDITKHRAAENNLLIALENLEILNKKHIQDLALARKIQRSLLPEKSVRFPGVAITSAYAPCDELGGDIVGVFPVDDARIAVYGGDVAGHGVNAAMVMSYVKKLIETSVKRVFIQKKYVVKPPGAVLTTINNHFISELNLGDPEMYLTLFLGVLDRRDLSFEFSSAGIHVPPMVVRENGVRELFTQSDIPIGYDRNHQYETSRERFSRNDIFIFVTDGVVDARSSGTRFGACCLKEDILHNLVDGHELNTEGILNDVRRFMGEERLEDDMCVLSMSFPHEDQTDPQLPGPPIMR
jgi:serine phosphatase RsbU (regulator of sigma subunit)